MAFRYPIGLPARRALSCEEPRAIALPGRTTQVFPSAFRRPTALLGFIIPFAGLIPQPGGHAETLAFASRRTCGSTPLCSSASTFLPVRTHVPFVPPPPPRLIFVGVTDRLLELQDLQKRSAGDADGVDFWALAPVCGPSRQRVVWLTKRSCLGLCLLQGCRAHFAVHRPGSTPLPITNPRSADGKLIRRRRFLSAHGLCRRSFPSRGSCHPARAAAGMLLIA